MIKADAVEKKRRIAANITHNSCFFRTTTTAPFRKALLQITERCNLRCAHCFVSATRHGKDMSVGDIQYKILPQLVEANVISLTLTGGEPMVHPDVEDIITMAVGAGLAVTVCTNGYFIERSLLERLKGVGSVKFNVSLDGFGEASHSRFRGMEGAFRTAKDTIALLAEFGLLKGLLVTPNLLSSVAEYYELARFARHHGAEYVLMNPLYGFGRGIQSTRRLRSEFTEGEEFALEMKRSLGDAVELVRIRMKNTDSLPLSGCEAGKIFYIFVSGDLAVCPYLVFAANTRKSLYQKEEFLAGNVFSGASVRGALDRYDFGKLKIGGNPTCRKCAIAGCGKGCPAIAVANGESLGSLDAEACPRSDLFGGD